MELEVYLNNFFINNLKLLQNEKENFIGRIRLALLATAGFGVNKSMSNKAQLSDLALANVEALAQDEGGGMANKCCPIWNVTIEIGGTIWPKVTCSTGGSYKCEDCTCPN